MALQLQSEYETPAGFVVESTYWRWVGLGIDVAQGKATGVLYAYVSESAYGAAKQPIGQRSYEIVGNDFLALASQLEAQNNGGLSSIIYAWVKNHDEYFSTANEV